MQVMASFATSLSIISYIECFNTTKNNNIMQDVLMSTVYCIWIFGNTAQICFALWVFGELKKKWSSIFQRTEQENF